VGRAVHNFIKKKLFFSELFLRWRSSPRRSDRRASRDARATCSRTTFSRSLARHRLFGAEYSSDSEGDGPTTTAVASGGKPSGERGVVRLQRAVRRFLGERRRRERPLRERATKLLQRTVRRFLAKRRFCGWGNLAFQELGESWLDEDEGTFGGLIYEGTEMRWVGAGSDAEASVSSNDSTEEESGGVGLECAGGGGGYTEDSVPYLVVGGGVEGGKPWWAVVSCWSKWSKYYQRTEISNENSYWGMCPPGAWEHFARPEDMVATIGIGKAAEIALGKIGGCLAFQEELPQIVCREASAVKRILEGSVFDTPENMGNPNGHARANDWIAWSASWVERMGQRWIDEGRGEAPVIVHGPRALGPLFRQASSRKGISKHAHLMNPDAVAYRTGKDYASWRDVLDEFEYGDPLFSSKKMEKSRIKEHLGWLMTVDDSGTAARVGIPERLYLATHHNGWWQPGLQRIKPSNYCAKYPECPDEEEAARALSAGRAIRLAMGDRNKHEEQKRRWQAT
jgi:hypothetical protein